MGPVFVKNFSTSTPVAFPPRLPYPQSMPLHLITDERCVNYHLAGHPERPQRITRTLEHLRSQPELKLTWEKPAEVPEETILRAHTKEHLARVKAATADFDGDTPAHAGIHDHALRSIGDRKSTRLNSSHSQQSRMPSSA